LGTKVLLKLANYINIGGAAVADGIEDTLEKMSDQKIAGYLVNKLYQAASVGRNPDISTPKELTDLIVKGTSGALEFSETLPAVGAFGQYISAIKSLPDVVADGLVKKTIKETKQKKIAERYNVGGARIATMEAAEDARIAAAKVADANKDIAQELIIAFEDKVGRTV
jgi:hypothetical protein